MPRRNRIRQVRYVLAVLAFAPCAAAWCCERLQGWADNDAAVISSEFVRGGPPHCRVRGVIAATINFELLLPEDWNGKFLMGGAGGFVGHLRNQAQAGLSAGPTPLERGYATVSTDTGHNAPRLSAEWALRDAAARENYAHRAVHRTAETAKAIVADYYSRSASRSYFLGCSNGGRQALISAQRYPRDFDGIFATATAFDFPATAAQFIQIQQTVYPNPKNLETPVITPQNVELVAASVNRACDALDGVADGVIDDPRMCRFEVDRLPACKGEAAPHCVTDAQRAAIETVYAGAIVDGKRIAPGFAFGGENDADVWPTWITRWPPPVAESGAPNAQYGFATQFFKYFVFRDPAWDYARYDFVDWDNDTVALGELLNANDPNIDAFRDHGGKLILAHGWADAGVPAQFSIDYYRSVEQRDPRAHRYARLFLLPGVAHCGGGPGPDQVDWIAALEQWVERDRPPASVLATKLDDRGAVVRERPVCAYPEIAHYDGSGDPDIATSYTCTPPATGERDGNTEPSRR